MATGSELCLPACNSHWPRYGKVLKTRDTAVGVASRLQVGQPTDHVSIPSKCNSIFSLGNEDWNWGIPCNQFHLWRGSSSGGEAAGKCSLLFLSFCATCYE